MIAFLLAFCCLALPQNGTLEPDDGRIASVKRLYAEQRWEEILRLAPGDAEEPAELDLYRGLACARLRRWAEAKAALDAGHRKQPRDNRFLLELAGVAYEQKQFSEARAYLQQALQLDPSDAYGQNFLASVYFLQGNLDAAVRHWNRIRKPYITAIDFDPPLRVRAELLNRALAFSPLDVLRFDELETTRARMENLGIFPQFRFEVIPNQDESFRVVFRASERNGWGDGVFGGLLSLFRGLPYQTVYPEFYNLEGFAFNITSLVRWDAQKRRVQASVSSPLGGNPALRLTFYLDARNENWELRRTLAASTAPGTGLNLEKAEVGAEIRSAVSGRWGWRAGAAFAYRKFRNLSGVALSAAPLFPDGSSLKYRAGLDYRVLRDPERRITATAIGSAELGRAFAGSLGAFGRIEASLALRWLPRPRGEDYETNLRVRTGRVLGRVPFDEVYELGLERDNDLWLRGHLGTRDGKKGRAPLGREYLLWNWETDKIVYRGGLLTVKFGPLLDVGRIRDPTHQFISRGWLFDAGAQCKLRALSSVTVLLSYGKDLRSGGNAFFATVLR